MPIYRSDADKAELARFYLEAGQGCRAPSRWWTLRALRQTARAWRRPLDVVHLARSTLELIRTGDPVNMS